MSRAIKQLLIAAVFLAIVGGGTFGIYRLVTEQSSCTDGIQNGKEEGVDCGLLACNIACIQILPIEIRSQELLEVKENDYDVIVSAYNPNSNYGTGLAEYSIRLLDESGVQILEKNGSFYILPGQTKYLVFPSIFSPREAFDIVFEVKSVEWETLGLPDLAQFSIIRQDYRELEDSKSEFEAVIRNNTDFDLDRVDISIILFDELGEIVGINKTVVYTFLSQSERYFKVNWPEVISPVDRVSVEVSTNIFENANFLKTRGTQEKFQRYY